MLTGEKLCNLRKKEGWSQSELANKLNLSRQSISKWELNESLPDAENIVKISNLFNVTTDYLLKDDAEITQPSNETQKKKYYTVQGIITTLSGIVTIGIINIIGETYNTNHSHFTTHPFSSFVNNYGVAWLVYLAVAVITTGLSLLLRDLYINKSKKYNRLEKKPLMAFSICTFVSIIISIFCFWYYFEIY